MKYTIWIIIVFIVIASFGLSVQADNLYLVKDGKVCSVIVSPVKRSQKVQAAIDEMQHHIKRASGVTLGVVDAVTAKSMPSTTVRVVIGGDTKQLGIDVPALPVEGFRVKTINNNLIFMGDGGKSDSLLWAVDHYLDTQLGVRWLWPGEVGTYVPQRSTILLAQIDYTGRPELERRILRNPLNWRRYFNGIPLFLSKEEQRKLSKESVQWLTRFQAGSRSRYSFGHSFTKWWDKYGETHPNYFAVPPAGKKQEGGSLVKLNVGNEAVDAAIIAEWQAAGAPDNWNVCPNDGVGFDTSAASRAMDDPPNQDIELIWGTPDANLTARYVKFWNRLIVKMRRINPKVKLTSYAYSAYRNPPLHGLKLQPGIVLGLVPSFWDTTDSWKGWQEAGAQLFLRPNWWYTGSVAPVLPLHRQGNFFKFAQSHNMIGYDFDSLMGNWATAGPMYYVIARLSVHPEMSVDDVINEYCSAFGKAAPGIKKYLNYWEQYTENVAFVPPEENVEKKKWYNYYDDEALNDGYAILDKASLAAAHDNDLVKQRILFLRQGLNIVKATRDVLQLGYIKQRTPDQEKEYEVLAKKLLALRREYTLSNVVWGEASYYIEKLWHIPTITDSLVREPGVRMLMKLDADWHFKTDPHKSGIQQGFSQATFNDGSWKIIQTTDNWQNQGFPDYHGTAWYRKTIEVPKVEMGQQLLLSFGAVDGDAIIYVNGRKAGEHLLDRDGEGWNQQFDIDITHFVQAGKNTLAVQVTKSTFKSGIYKGVALLSKATKEEQ